jgi:hypothetical protein
VLIQSISTTSCSSFDPRSASAEVAALDGGRGRIDIARRLDHRVNLADARPFGFVVILLGVSVVLV